MQHFLLKVCSGVCMWTDPAPLPIFIYFLMFCCVQVIFGYLACLAAVCSSLCSLSVRAAVRDTYTHTCKADWVLFWLYFRQIAALYGGVGVFICAFECNSCETIWKEHFISLIHGFVLVDGACSLCLTVCGAFTNNAAYLTFNPGLI